MDSIAIRYGENVSLPINADDVQAVSADIYIGKPGETYKLTKHAELLEGIGVFEFTIVDTELPLDVYYYQINTTDGDGHVKKFPSPADCCDGCENNFPSFIVAEALDKIEVS